MKIAVIGAGYTGLAAGLKLAQAGQQVTVFEAGESVGGLSVGLKEKGWKWTAEKFYHHIFTNDVKVIELSRSLGLEPIFSRPISAVFWPSPRSAGRGGFFPLDAPVDLLRFPGLGLADKLRMGLVLGGFKLLPGGLAGRFLEGFGARAGLTALMGKAGYETIWEPLLEGKFHQFKDEVNLAWFWARIKKRTSQLGTFPGGFQALADRMAEEITRRGGEIKLNTLVEPEGLKKNYKIILSTIPAPITDYLDAHVLFLEMDQPLFQDIYWLNILDRRFPFLVAVDHTNFIDSSHFGGSHLAYFGNYLPQNHQLFSLSSNEVLKEFLPWIKKISPGFSRTLVKRTYVFHGEYAQPVMTVNYSKQVPAMKQGKGVYVANQAMIYPWDRGVNQAVELGQKVAGMILKDQKF